MDEIFKVLTGETHKARSMYPAKLSSVSEEEIKTSQTSKNLRNWLPVELPCKNMKINSSERRIVLEVRNSDQHKERNCIRGEM